CRWTRRKHVRDVAGLDRVQRHVSDLLGYLEHNQGALVPYAARRRREEPISTAFVESAVNEIVAKRMNKAGYSDEAGRGYRSEAGRCSDVKPATVPI
ncbi:MAG TPA: hypothetical protein VKG87_07500, partial [Terriglobales bacterium]|nr:hypothetical protein [Terriglobales bacterium]